MASGSAGGLKTDSKFAEKFWAKTIPVTETGCLLWMGSLDLKGYGSVRFDGKTRRAHRVAWVLSGGTIPAGMELMHACDVRSCVSPRHLSVGTHKQNVQDCVRKGHKARGAQCGQTPLGDEQVLDMRRRAAAGESLKSISAAFGLNISSTNMIVHGRRWAHLPGALPLFRPPKPEGWSPPRAFPPGEYRGANRPTSKLTDAKVREIRNRSSAGEAGRSLAAAFGVSVSLISRVVNGRGWKHVA